MTTIKARTEGEKRRARRERAAQRLEQLSGVSIVAEQDARQRAAQSDTEAITRTLARRCAVMDWADTQENRQRARNQKLATLYGRLYVAGRISEAVYDGIERWVDLDDTYARVVLGRQAPSRGDPPIDPCDPRDLARDWIAAHGVIGSCPPACRDMLAWTLAAAEDVKPADVAEHHVHALRVVAKALARHFRVAV